jgi:hypothetical protein
MINKEIKNMTKEDKKVFYTLVGGFVFCISIMMILYVLLNVVG